MEHAYDFLSSDGEHTIYTVSWLPEGPARAVVQIATGMVEHILRYEDFGRFLASHGFAVVGSDHLGQGRTAVSKEELGFFGKRHSDYLVEDMHSLRERVAKDYPGLPYFMLGHSMGSFMLRKYLALYGRGLAGAIVMGTGYTDPVTSGAGLFLNRMLTMLKGEHYRSPLMASLATGSGPYKDFCLDGSDPTRAWLTKDTEIVRTYYESPYCTYVYTLNGYRGLLEAVRFANTPANVKKIDRNIPIFVVSGSDDPVGDMGKGVRKAFDLFRQAGILDVELKIFEGDRHEILNETDRYDTVYPSMLAWLEKHL